MNLVTASNSISIYLIAFSIDTSSNGPGNRFVNLMEGHIWVESEGLGKGSTAIFIVKLGIPGCANESKLPFMAKLTANHMQVTFQGLKVLVMDDNG